MISKEDLPATHDSGGNGKAASAPTDGRRRFLIQLGSLAVPVWSASVWALSENPKAGSAPGSGNPAQKRIGLALGAGGANGLAHIPLLEALDDMGVVPHQISGSSIGAVIGALYASKMSGKEIRKLVLDSFADDGGSPLRKLMSDEATHWLELVEVEFGGGGLVDSQRILSYFYDSLASRTFESLTIPLKVVAADLWTKEQVVLESGPVLPAVQASMALPGVFEPVQLGDHVLVDGGMVNPVPWDLLLDECDFVIGVDVTGVRTRPEGGVAGYFEGVFNSVKIMQQAIIREKQRRHSPDIFITPDIRDIRALEFYRAQEILDQAESARRALEEKLSRLL